MLFGACAALALLTMLATREPALNDRGVYIAGATLGAAYVLLLGYVFAQRPARLQSTPMAIGCGCAYAAAGFFFLVPMAMIIDLTTGTGLVVQRTSQLIAFFAAYCGLGILGGLMLARFRRTEAERQEAALAAQAASFAHQQLELARDLQQRLLPQPLLESERFRISARNIPAAYVAGDFYDFVPLRSGGLLIVLADVAGKGVAAGLIMATVKATIPLLAAQQRHAAPLLGQLNEQLTGHLSRREFVALVLAIYDPDSGALTIANAGLPDPLMLPADGTQRPVVVLGPRYPVGIRRNLSYESVTAKLAPGDRMVFFTDGLPEAALHAEPLGYERLAAEIKRTCGDPDALFASLETLGAAHDDDWTAIMLERLG